MGPVGNFFKGKLIRAEDRSDFNLTTSRFEDFSVNEFEHRDIETADSKGKSIGPELKEEKRILINANGVLKLNPNKIMFQGRD